jgi:hypothetical protein
MGAPGAWTLTNSTRTDILNGAAPFNSGSGTFKVALFTSSVTLSASTTTYAGLSGEVGTTNTGYTTGGIGVTFAEAGTTNVTLKFSTNPVWTAGTANLTARYAVLYKISGDVIAYALLDATPADVTVTSGNTLTIDGITNAVLTLA